MERRLQRLVNLAMDAIIAVDARQRIILFNQGAEKTFGYKAAEVLGRPLSMLMPARSAGEHAGHMANFDRSRRASKQMAKRGAITGLRRDGSEFPAEASIAVLHEETGPVFFAIMRDITEKRRVAERIEYLATHDSLTGLINRGLMNDRLAHALAGGGRA